MNKKKLWTRPIMMELEIKDTEKRPSGGALKPGSKIVSPVYVNPEDL